MEKIVIKVSGETDLDSTLKKLTEVGVVDDKNAKSFVENSKKVDGAVKTTNGSVGSLGKALQNIGTALPGGQIISQFQALSTTISSTTGAASGAAKGMGVLRLSMLALPIFAIIAGITSLIAYFKSTEQGSEKLERAFAKVGAAAKVIIGRVAALGEGLFEIFYKGNFTKGATILKDAFTGIGDEVKRASKEAGDFTKKLQDIEDEENNMQVAIAKSINKRQELAILAKRAGEDTKEGIALIKQAVLIEKESIDKQIALQQRKVDALKIMNDHARATGEIDQENEIEEYREAQVKLENLRGNSLEVIAKLENRAASLSLKDQKAANKAKLDEEKKHLKEVIDANYETLGNQINIEAEKEKVLAKSFDTNKKQTSIFGDWLKKGQEKFVKDYEASEKEKTKIAEEQAAKRAYFIQKGLDLAGQALNAYESTRLANEERALENERSKVQQQTDNLIANLDKRREAGVISETTYAAQKENILKNSAKKEAEIKKKLFLAEQKAAVNKVLIDSAVAIIKTFAQLGWPAGIAGAVAVGASAGIQIAAIKSQTPGYKDGVIDLQGPGTSTSDSIPARLSKGESVIKAKSTMKYTDELHAIQNDSFPDYVYKKYVLPEIQKDNLQDKRRNDMAKGIASSLVHQESFNEAGIINAIKGNKKVRIENLTDLVEKRDEKRYSW